MSLAYHCDHEGCDTWQREHSELPGGFVIVTDTSGAVLGHFCTLDCLMHWAAEHSAPTEVVP